MFTNCFNETNVLKRRRIPQSVLEKEKKLLLSVKEMNKPAEVLEGIIKGKLEKYKKKFVY